MIGIMIGIGAMVWFGHQLRPNSLPQQQEPTGHRKYTQVIKASHKHKQ